MKRLMVAGVAAAAMTAGSILLAGSQATADVQRFHAVLHDPSGATVGIVRFRVWDDGMLVWAVLRPNPYVTADSFHGFHLHANNDPSNGSGCVADASQPSSTWFVSADGHFSEAGQTHGHHDGDLASPLVMSDGTARLRFFTDRIDPADLVNLAAMLHAGPDNFGNVPTGTAPDQYTANSPAAPDKTSKTGNAGDRVACGLVHSPH